MGKTKLSKSLFKVLFPSKKKSSSSSTSSSNGNNGRGSGHTQFNENRSAYDDPFLITTSYPLSSSAAPPGASVVGKEGKFDSFLKEVMEPRRPEDDDGTSPSAAPTERSPATATSTSIPASNDSSSSEPRDACAVDRPPPPNSAKKVQFSTEEKEEGRTRASAARAKAIARQKRILSRATLRLDAISNTSLEMAFLPDNAAAAAYGGKEGSGREATRAEVAAERRIAIDSLLATASDVPAAAESEFTEGKDCVGSTVTLHESQENEELEISSADRERDAVTTSHSKQERRSKGKEKTPENKREGWQEPSEANTNNIQFFILLLCPTSRIFELVEVSAGDAPHNGSTVRDVLGIIPRKCTDERLRRKDYRGFVRPTDRANFSDRNAKAFGTGDGPSETEEEGNVIRKGDVLVAILEGYSGQELSQISKPILNNSGFRNMIRRRSRNCNRQRRGSDRSDNLDGSLQSKRSAKLLRKNSDGSLSSKSSKRPDRPVADGGTPKRVNRSADRNENDRYSSLCQKLENLSKKLDHVDDEIKTEDASLGGNEAPAAAAEGDAAPELDATAREPNENDADAEIPTVRSSPGSFKMAPQMLAKEISANIKDIFAEHDVQIVTVDAEGADNRDSDEDTFATARSQRTTKSMRSVRSLGVKGLGDNSMPVLEITTKKKKKKRKPRKSRPSKFDFGEDDMMMQIEAMARQADAAFESRKEKSVGGRSMTIIEPTEPTAESAVAPTKNFAKETDPMPVVHKNTNDDDRDAAVGEAIEEEARYEGKSGRRSSVSFADETGLACATKPAIGGEQSDGESIDEESDADECENAISTYTAGGGERNALSRTLLDASTSMATSMVSTMVANSRGGVNEVHVLQYLGVPIVCIAANMMQQQGGGGGNGGDGRGGLPDFTNPRGKKRGEFGVKEVFQSAMFLAFMVNGQRYLAKVTKK